MVRPSMLSNRIYHRARAIPGLVFSPKSRLSLPSSCQSTMDEGEVVALRLQESTELPLFRTGYPGARDCHCKFAASILTKLPSFITGGARVTLSSSSLLEFTPTCSAPHLVCYPPCPRVRTRTSDSHFAVQDVYEMSSNCSRGTIALHSNRLSKMIQNLPTFVQIGNFASWGSTR